MELPDNIKRNKDNSLTLQQGTIISFVAINIVNNESFFPIFMNWDELRKWQNVADQQTPVVNLTDYQAILDESNGYHGIAINPFGKSFIIDRAMLAWGSAYKSKQSANK
ncbi:MULTISPECIES: SseB family protein [Frischella]|nr:MULTISPECIES: SseB family protein [Frischella]